MKFFVLGCNGMAGHMISAYLKEQGHEVTGFARKRSVLVDTVLGDAMNIEPLLQHVKDGEYDAVVNSIGILTSFAERDTANAIFINAYLPHVLAKATKDTKTILIQQSTDCVFSGTRGGYTVDDFPDGSSIYDRTKALGELTDNKNITIRCSIIGPDMNPQGIGLLNWFMQANGTVKGYRKAIWTGITTLELAKAVEVAVRNKAYGLIQLVPDVSINKYQLLELFNMHLRESKVNIVPDDSLKIDKSLIRSRNDSLACLNIPNYEEMILELKGWMQANGAIYRHYPHIKEGMKHETI